MTPARRAALRAADTVVFLCSGNMVRSAFAELYARHAGFPRDVLSAATTYRNDRVFPETALALRARGVDEEWIRSFRPTHLDDLLPRLTGTPVFLGMRHHHLESVDGFLLVPDTEIADPVLEGADFERTFAQVAAGVEALRDELLGKR
jgi:protein-tyrosine-phosphatase